MLEQSEYLLIDNKPSNKCQKIKKIGIGIVFSLVIVAFLIEIVLIAVKYFSMS